MSETRIGQALLDTGTPAQALVVSAERIERSQCSRSQRAICVAADNLIATAVFDVSGLRAGTEIRLSPDEFDTYETGAEVFVDLIYLPSDPSEVERSPGQRLSSASGNMLNIYVLAAFGFTFALIGGIAVLITRKRTRRT